MWGKLEPESGKVKIKMIASSTASLPASRCPLNAASYPLIAGSWQQRFFPSCNFNEYGCAPRAMRLALKQ